MSWYTYSHSHADVHARSIYFRVRNYRSPSRHWRLTFRVGDHQLVTWSPKKTKKRKRKRKTKKETRAVANLSQRRRADRERAFFLLFFRFGLIENETRIAKLPPVTRMQGATVQSYVAGAFHTCGRKIEKETKRHDVIIHNSKAGLRFLRCFVVKEGGRIQSGHFSFPFWFDRVRETDCETLTCHVHARRYSAVFSAISLFLLDYYYHYQYLWIPPTWKTFPDRGGFPARVVERTKRHNNQY